MATTPGPNGAIHEDAVGACSAPTALTGGAVLDAETARFYCRAMAAMEGAGVPYLVGGAYAFERYTGIARHTKDFDVFVRREEAPGTQAQFLVMAVNCTHLGCPVTWFADSGLFMCPCHGGVYYANGEHASGPPPRGLSSYADVEP